MRRYRKFFGVFMSLVLILGTVPMGTMPVFAEGGMEAGNVMTAHAVAEGVYQEGGFLSGQANADVMEEQDQKDVSMYLNGRRDYSGKTQTVQEFLYASLINYETSINIEQYHVSVSDVGEIYRDVINTHPDLFFVSSGFGYSYLASQEVSQIKPQYTLEREEMAQAYTFFEEETEKILSQVKASWSDLEKALFLQDYICTHFEYDTSYKIYDVYQFLKQKKGVCQAYSLLYYYLTKQAGIEGTYASSDKMNHIWNVIKIDGSWYHVDVTWNDPLNDMPGRAKHVNFLKSDAGIAASGSGGHHDWVSDVVCDNTELDNVFWEDVDTSFAYAGGQWYFLDKTNKKIQGCDLKNIALLETVYAIKDNWYVQGNTSQYWRGAMSGFGGYDDLLYFNTPDTIWAFDVKEQAAKAVYKLDASETNDIYNFYIDGNILYYVQAETPNDEIMKVTGEVELPEHQHEYDAGVVTKQSTCIEEGEITYTCRCGDTKTEKTELADHAASEEWSIIEVSCTDGGIRGIKCKVCGEVLESEEFPAPGHQAGQWETMTEVSCAEDGLNVIKCGVCGEILEEEIKTATGHHWEKDTVVKEPSCTESGRREQTCSLCGETREEILAKSHHKYRNDVCEDCGQRALAVFEDEGIVIDNSSYIISGIKDQVSVEQLKERTSYIIQALDYNHEMLEETETVGTGSFIQVMENGKLVEEYQVCVKGDTTGDGIISVLDMEGIQKSILGVSSLEGVYEQAAMLAEGGIGLSVLDMEIVQKHILGISVIGE